MTHEVVGSRGQSVSSPADPQQEQQLGEAASHAHHLSSLEGLPQHFGLEAVMLFRVLYLLATLLHLPQSCRDYFFSLKLFLRNPSREHGLLCHRPFT